MSPATCSNNNLRINESAAVKCQLGTPSGSARSIPSGTCLPSQSSPERSDAPQHVAASCGGTCTRSGSVFADYRWFVNYSLYQPAYGSDGQVAVIHHLLEVEFHFYRDPAEARGECRCFVFWAQRNQLLGETEIHVAVIGRCTTMPG